VERRQFLRTGSALCAVIPSACAVPPTAESPGSVDRHTAAIYNSPDEATRRRTRVSSDHPLRQYYNVGFGPGVGPTPVSARVQG